MEVNNFQILLIGVTFHFQHVQKLIGNVLIKMLKVGTGGLRVKSIKM